MQEINIIRNEYPDIKFIFDFLDRFADKMKKASVTEKNSTTVVFEDYYDKTTYYVPIEVVNRVLDYCYNEYFFKIVLSGSSFYKKVKKICDELNIDVFTYDLFFRSLFLAIKDRSKCNSKNSYRFTKDIVYDIVLNSHSKVFTNIPSIDLDYYSKKSKLILQKLEKEGLLSYHQNNITKDDRLSEYFVISCDTFNFSITDDKFFHSFSIRMFDFLELRRFLDNQDFLKSSLLARMEKAIQVVIVTSFINIKFYMNSYSDNSYVKQIFIDKEFIANNM